MTISYQETCLLWFPISLSLFLFLPLQGEPGPMGPQGRPGPPGHVVSQNTSSPLLWGLIYNFAVKASTEVWVLAGFVLHLENQARLALKHQVCRLVCIIAPKSTACIILPVWALSCFVLPSTLSSFRFYWPCLNRCQRRLQLINGRTRETNATHPSRRRGTFYKLL